MQTYQDFEPNIGGAGSSGLAWGLCVVAALRMLRTPASPTHRALQSHLARAELLGEISEFCALCMQALLAMSEESEFAEDYLEMAVDVASSPLERAIVAEMRMAYDWLQAHPQATSESIQATLVHDCSAMAPWNELVTTLCQAGKLEASTLCKLLDPRAA
jgi:hypothetical protein